MHHFIADQLIVEQAQTESLDIVGGLYNGMQTAEKKRRIRRFATRMQCRHIYRAGNVEKRVVVIFEKFEGGAAGPVGQINGGQKGGQEGGQRGGKNNVGHFIGHFQS